MIYVYIGIAGFFGALVRYLISLSLAGNSGVFPFATLTINLFGSFLLAWLSTLVFKRIAFPEQFRTAISTGFVGSFTTFSTLSVETVKLFQVGHPFFGVIYVALSFFGGLAMCRLGFNLPKGGERE